MALGGQKPKPVALKIIQGNPGKRSLETAVAAPKDGPIPIPDAVVRSERAKAYWDHYIENAAPGHLAPIDAPILGQLCVVHATLDEAQEKLELYGMVVKAPNTGLPIQSPYMSIVNKQREIMRRLAAELSLPPAQRNRIVPNGKGNAESEFDEFLS